MPAAVIDLRLTGFLNLNRIAFDQVAAANLIQEQAEVFAVSIDTSGINAGGPNGAGGAAADAGLSREEIEKKAIKTLVNDDALWGLAVEGDAFASLFFDLKEAVRQGRSTEELAECVSQSPLVEKIRVAKATPPPPVPTAAESDPVPTP